MAKAKSKKTKKNTKAVVKAKTKSVKKIVKVKSKTVAKKTAKTIKTKAVAKKSAKNAARKTKSDLKAVSKINQSPHKNVPAKTQAVLVSIEKFMTPLDDRLIVEADLAEKVTAGGLIIPDTVSDVSGNIRGRVLAAGRGRRDKFGKIHSMDVKKGDLVLFAEHSGSIFSYMGKDFKILREAEILGVVI